METPIKATGRLSLRVRDLARSREFYRDVLGFAEIEGGGGDRAYLSVAPGDDRPALILIQAGDRDAPGPAVDPDPLIGMEHFAFEIDSEDFSALKAAYRHLKAKGAEIHHTVDHRVTYSIYFLDPDRNLIEVYINRPPAEYEGHRDNPYGSFESLEARLAAPEPVT